MRTLRGKAMKRFKFYGLVFLGTLWVMFAVLAVRAPAQDHDTRWVYRTIWKQGRVCDVWGHCYVRRWRETQRFRNHVYHHPETRVRSYVKREDDRRIDRGKCARDDETHREIWIEVLSTEHQSEENAREAARKAWMARAQWDVGGTYMNLDEAEGVKWRCGPSNAHDTASGRISEAVGTVTGKGGQNVRCSVVARPCRGPRESDRRR
jgi:hypothetical protein